VQDGKRLRGGSFVRELACEEVSCRLFGFHLIDTSFLMGSIMCNAKGSGKYKEAANFQANQGFQ